MVWAIPRLGANQGRHDEPAVVSLMRGAQVAERSRAMTDGGAGLFPFPPPARPSARPPVLLATGAMNPPHSLRDRALRIACLGRSLQPVKPGHEASSPLALVLLLDRPPHRLQFV